MDAMVTRGGRMGWRATLLACACLSLSGSSLVHAAPRHGSSSRALAVPLDLPLADGSLTREALLRTKAATVFIRVDAKGGELQGTGFFALGPGLVLTNAHVAAPEDATSRDVRVVLNSGTPAERSLPAKVIAADADADLAVLSVTGKNLPEPLALAPAAGLLETMPLYVFGFPFGDGLAAKGHNPELSVLRASVSCLRHTGSGRLDVIQLDGELHPGNSGGPVLDVFGRVVAITASRLRSTRIGFAIPGERVHQLLGGPKGGATVQMHPRPGTPGARGQIVARTSRNRSRRRASTHLW